MSIAYATICRQSQMLQSSGNSFWRKKAALVAHPSNPRMSSTSSTAHPGISHDAQLLPFDTKTVIA